MARVMILIAPGDGKYEHGDILALFEDDSDLCKLFNPVHFLILDLDGTVAENRWLLAPMQLVFDHDCRLALEDQQKLCSARQYCVDVKSLWLYKPAGRLPRDLILDKACWWRK